MVELSVDSKKFKCNLTLNYKVTFIVGDSGVGKTQLTKRLSSKRSGGISIECTQGFTPLVFTADHFSTYLKRAKDSVAEGKYKGVSEYWKSEFPLSGYIIVIDDEDFISSHDFADFYNHDKENYYVFISRVHLSSINYSVSEVYKMVKDGVFHHLEPVYQLPKVSSLSKFDYVVTEGQGSDFIFFDEFFKSSSIEVSNLGNSGKDFVSDYFLSNLQLFSNKSILLMVDYCAFGSQMNNIERLADVYNLDIKLVSIYDSFEYLLLKCKLVDDTQLGNFVYANITKYQSLEQLYTKRLQDLTKDTLYSYSKSKSKFPLCFYKPCCSVKAYRKELCDKRMEYLNKDKFEYLLKGTEFEFLLDLRDFNK